MAEKMCYMRTSWWDGKTEKHLEILHGSWETYWVEVVEAAAAVEVEVAELKMFGSMHHVGLPNSLPTRALARDSERRVRNHDVKTFLLYLPKEKGQTVASREREHRPRSFPARELPQTKEKRNQQQKYVDRWDTSYPTIDFSSPLHGFETDADADDADAAVDRLRDRLGIGVSR